MDKKIALVTGASSGIGKATVLELFSRGFIVYGAARNKDKLQELDKKGINSVVLDITDDSSMISCINEILRKESRIDILVNNAGYGSYGAIEDVPLPEARHQFEVNLFGLARMIQLVLPSMRKNKYGKIVNISSVAGKVATPFGGWYHATKFAVEGLSDCLRMELIPFGIDVIIVEPGGIKTNWGKIAAENLKKTSANGVYAEKAGHAADRLMGIYESATLSEPQIIAETIGKALTVSKPKTRYLAGHGARSFIFIRHFTSDRMLDKFMLKKLG